MEPDLGGQEKGRPWGSSRAPTDGSQWSLTLEVRKRGAANHPREDCAASQWSLTLEVRKSPPGRPAANRHRPVAMEPDLGGQEKVKIICDHLRGTPVAMEPDLGGQEKSCSISMPLDEWHVAMEPDLGGQEKAHAHSASPEQSNRRNGA